MKKQLLCVLALFMATVTFGQLTGTKYIPGSGGPNDYATIALAVADLNAVGVGAGGVTFEVAAGHTETGFNILLTTTTASAANPIVFIKTGAGANPLITAGVGTSTTVDAIIKIRGTDYVTFNGIDLLDPASNTTSTTRMEWGYAILMTSATDASQNITIVNCNITLQKVYSSASGIYSKNHTDANTTLITPSSAAGVVSNCTVDNCHISNVNYGVNWTGSSTAAYYGLNNYFGVTIPNTITNVGNTTAAAYGFYAQYQQNLKINNNTITLGGADVTTGALYGIYTGSTGATNTSAEFVGNNISLSAIGANSCYGIYNTSGASGTTNTVNISGNYITVSAPKFTSGTIYGIYNNAALWKFDMNSNMIYSCTVGDGTTTATGTFAGCYTFGSNTTPGGLWTFTGNLIDGITRAQSVKGSGTFYGIYNSSSALTLNITDNTVSNISMPGSGTAGCIYVSNSSATSMNLQNNSVTDVSKPGGINATPSSGTIYGLYVVSSGTNALCTVQENNVTGVTNSWRGQILPYRCDGGATSTMKIFKNRASNISSNDAAMFGIYSGAGLNLEIFGNLVYNFHADVGDSASFYGICSGSTTTNSVASIYNNYLSDLSAPQANVYLSSGLYLFGTTAGTTHRFYNNTVYLD